MFTKKEKRMLGGGYFTIIREEENFIEVMSNCTKHYWVILKKISVVTRPIVLYHKHTGDTKYYHKQWESWTVGSLVNCIKAHDDYVLEEEKNGI